jgi:uncharacterized protein YecE (DUF72 family)
VTGRASFHTDSDRRIRHVIEIRNASFMCDDFLGLLREYDVALVFSDAATDWPYAEDVTSDIIYARLHGSEVLYASGYDAAALERWARKARAWMRGTEPRDAVRVGSRSAPRARGRDVYIFFDNDAKVHAPFDAMDLADRLGIDWRHHHAQ